MFDNKPLNFPKNQENGNIDNGDDSENETSHEPITTDKEDCCDEDDEIFVDSEKRVAGNKYFFIVLKNKSYFT